MNPADCASHGLLPSELLTHDLWWNGPSWLKLGIQHQPIPDSLPPNEPSVEAKVTGFGKTLCKGSVRDSRNVGF